MAVPYFQPDLSEAEVQAVVECLRSGWLTTGPKAKQFEAEFSQFVGAGHAVALNSCTAALHLALDAVGLKRGELVLVPTFTFAATAEVVRYFDATPVFVDCESKALCMDPAHTAETLRELAAGGQLPGVPADHAGVRAIIPVHYAGQMVEVDAFRTLADEHEVALIEDAAHTLPAYYRSSESAPWRSAGSTADITCFSFYANKCITTGEGGMAVTDREDYAERMRIMSLHGMSRDAWKRFTAAGSWYYEIVAPGFKYNLTDIAAAIGLCQLARANELWQARRAVASRLSQGLADVEEIELPTELANRQHSWHLFPVRLRLDKLQLDRAQFIKELKARGVGASVHWLPLHMQPYYRETYGYAAEHFPNAAAAWPRMISLPIFPSMTTAQTDEVVEAVRGIVGEHRARA
jgi:perosamine synthetase